jgi:hypothetical protein
LNSSSQSNVLQNVALNILTYPDCADEGTIYITDNKRQICAGDMAGGKGVCTSKF